MSRFHPFPGMFLQIASAYYEFLPHPLLPMDKDAVFVLEGAEAMLYKVRNVDTKRLYALKVFKPSYQDQRMAEVTDRLAELVGLPGLYLVRRICLTPMGYSDVVERFPELEYAILMPWIEAGTWAGLMLNPAMSAGYTRKDASDLALATARSLAQLAAHGLAHTDIAGANLLISPDRRHIELLDLEGMYIPGVSPPRKFSYGSPGYQHRSPGPYGQWCPEGDRFSGAILLAEMLTWWNPQVRAHIADYAEMLFLPQELQVIGSPCWQAVRDTLYSLNLNLLYLFDQVWTSTSLSECPDLSAWVEALLSQESISAS